MGEVGGPIPRECAKRAIEASHYLHSFAAVSDDTLDSIAAAVVE